MFNDQLTGILEQLYREHNRKHDCHYKDGYGALFVPEGYELQPRNVVLVIPEHQLVFMNMGSVFQFNFQ
jgi:hypothetical protein